MPGTSFERRAALWIVLAGGLALACAVSVPPSGGPEDKEAPKVLSTSPAADSAGVDPASPVTITFSEPMSREGFSRLVAFSPPIEIDRVHWSGNSVSITAWGGFHPDTTYLVTVRAGIRDRHRVASKKEFEFAFATSTVLDTARISGVVTFRRKPTAKAIVRAFVMPRDSAFTPESGVPDRQAPTDENGAYSLRYLAPGSRVIVWAFEDVNGNNGYDPEGDRAAAADTILLTPEAPVRSGVNIDIIDPDEPAVVSGRVRNQTGIDTLLVSVGMFAGADSLPARYYTKCDSAGRFELRKVRMGTYAIKAFIDIAPDSICGLFPCGPDSSALCPEPCASLPDSVTVKPGDELKLPAIVLPPASARKE